MSVPGPGLNHPILPAAPFKPGSLHLESQTMLRTCCAILLVAGLLAGCGRSEEPPLRQRMLAAPAAAPMAAVQEQHASKGIAAADAPTGAPQRRYMALHHQLQLRTGADQVEAAWRQAGDACAAAGCELLSSNLTRDEQRRPARASLVARVPPDKLDVFLERITALGSVGEHHKSADDRTDEVIDTQARIKNMAEFRDSLRRLMNTPGAKLKDLIEVERELVRVQSELDSLASRSKALANLTDKVLVSLTINAEPAVLQTGTWAPVIDALLGAGGRLASSVAVMLGWVVSALPWLLALGLAWAARHLWLVRRRRAAAAA
jgi:Domain of unknown function (DUF4349)